MFVIFLSTIVGFLLNNKIYKLYERALRIVCSEENLAFEQLLERDNSITVHQRNLTKLCIEMFKVKNGLSLQPIQELFFTHQKHTIQEIIRYGMYLLNITRYTTPIQNSSKK